MSFEPMEETDRRIGHAVRAACLQAALKSYEQSGLSGICEAGRREVAIGAIREINVEAVIHQVQNAGKPDD